MPIIVNKEQKVEEICEKAYKEFSETGIENFSLNKFVEEIGISKGQFYHYFKTKESLVFEVMSHKTSEMMKRTEDYLNEADTLLEKLLLFFSIYISDDQESKKIRQLMFDSFHIYIHSKDQKVRDYNREIYQWMDKKLIDIFNEAGITTVSLHFIKSISTTADGIYLRSLMVDDYDLKDKLTEYLTDIATTATKEI